MNFRDYYSQQFRQDLAEVMTEGWRLHVEDHDGPAVQPRTLSVENPAINRMAPLRQELFAVALYFTVLVDQVMFTYFRESYSTFRRLTLYPKLRGDCPGGCFYHVHPRTVFAAVAQPVASYTGGWFPRYAQSLGEAVPVMREEVVDFFREHMPHLDGTLIWAKCKNEPPLTQYEAQVGPSNR